MRIIFGGRGRVFGRRAELQALIGEQVVETRGGVGGIAERRVIGI
jgi:hypothetical protein